MQHRPIDLGGETRMFARFLHEWIRTNLTKDEGQTMAEYGLILAVVAVVVVATLIVLGTSLQGEIQKVINNLK
jgi:pilus assembly protein Flp/PilA